MLQLNCSRARLSRDSEASGEASSMFAYDIVIHVAKAGGTRTVYPRPDVGSRADVSLAEEPCRMMAK